MGQVQIDKPSPVKLTDEEGWTVLEATLQNAATADGNGAAATVGGNGVAAFQVTGITTATVTFQGTVDGTNWVDLLAYNVTDGSVGISTVANGVFVAMVAGLQQVRAPISGYAAGTITVYLQALPGASMSIADVDIAGAEDVMAQPFAPILEGGGVQLIGVDDQVDQNEYSASTVISFAGTYSGEVLNITLFTRQEGTGAILTPAGVLFVFDADPTISAGDAAMTSAERITVIAQIPIEAGDWKADANGASAAVSDVPFAFHPVAALYFVWFHESATSFNDVAGDDETLSMNAWIRRDS